MQIKFLKVHQEQVTPLTSLTWPVGHVLDIPEMTDGVQALLDAGICELVPVEAAPVVAVSSIAPNPPRAAPAHGATIQRTYDEMTVVDLRALAEDAGIANVGRMRKVDLIAALNEAVA